MKLPTYISLVLGFIVRRTIYMFNTGWCDASCQLLLYALYTSSSLVMQFNLSTLYRRSVFSRCSRNFSCSNSPHNWIFIIPFQLKHLCSIWIILLSWDFAYLIDDHSKFEIQPKIDCNIYWIVYILCWIFTLIFVFI